jgi:molecular chaperone DnaK (HSP70)
MGLLDGIERLINEHGSAAILKERIALANDKYAALEQTLSECEAAKIKLHSENETLRIDLEKAQVKVRNLEEKLYERHGHRLDEIREQILQLLAAHDGITDQQVARSAGVSEQVASFHLHELEAADFASRSLFVGQSSTPWHIEQEGRRYLVTHGLLA